MTDSASSSPIKSRRCSSTASETSLRDLEAEYLALRDEHLSYEDDAEFHIFIDALDRVDTLVTEHDHRAERRKSFGRILSGFKMRKDKPTTTTTTPGSTVEPA